MILLPILAALALTASDGQAPGQSRLSQAQAAFAEGDFDGALSHLEAASQQTQDDDLLAKIHLLRGQCFAALPDQAKASDAFTAALEHDPLAQLDKSKVRPSVVELLENLRETLRAHIKVKSDRSALVLLDGQTLGTAPISSEVSIGKHTLEVRNADGATLQKMKLVVKANETQEIKLKLAAAETAARDDLDAAAQPPAGSEGLHEHKAPGKSAKDADKTAEEMDEEPRSVHFVVEGRGAADPISSSTLGFGGEVGIGVSGINLGATLSGAYTAKAPGATLRATALVPELASVMGLHFSLGVPAVFTQSGVAVGGLASAGLDFAVADWLAPFLDVEGRYYFKPLTDGPDAQKSKLAVLFSLGLRFKL